MQGRTVSPAPFTVAEFNQRINRLLSSDPDLRHVRVEGEISGCKCYRSNGHYYFDLKDATASVSCALFSGTARSLSLLPADGMKVVLSGHPNLYDKNGRFSLIVEDLVEAGVGELYQAFLKLKEKLAKEGLFAAERKKQLPFIPRRIVAITSAAGAVIRDILHVSKRRFPGFSLLLLSVPVQGKGAELKIAEAIAKANALQLGDLIIVGRGGGSLEDLQPFNEEVVARAIAASEIPVISAVGHETDFTIADFVADMRAPTPSAAAEIAFPVKAQLLERIEQHGADIERLLEFRLQKAWQRLENLRNRPVLLQPSNFLERPHLQLRHLKQRLYGTCPRQVGLERERLSALVRVLPQNLEKYRLAEFYDLRDLKQRQLVAAKQIHAAAQAVCKNRLAALNALSPLAVLVRGYSIATAENGDIISDARQVAVGSCLDLRLRQGSLHCEVLSQDFSADAAAVWAQDGRVKISSD